MIRIKRAGWIYILLTVFLGIGAVNTGNNLIYIIVSAFLSFMALSGFFGKRNISNLEVTVEFPDEVYASRETMIKVTLRNRRRFLPAFLVRVIIEGKDAFFPYLDPKKEMSRYLRVTFLTRGRQILRDLYICSVFPFNFFMRCRTLRIEREVVVFPEPKEYRCLTYEFKGLRKRGEIQGGERGHDGDLLSLRNYTPGDPLKYIHWKASAKTGQFKTKELSTLTTLPAVIDLERLSEGDIEERLSFATYLVLRYSKTGIPFIIRIKGRVFETGPRGIDSTMRKEVLRELALYSVGQGKDDGSEARR